MSKGGADFRFPRLSMRTSVAFVVAVVTIAPLLLVLAWLQVERRFESKMKSNVAFSAEEAIQALEGKPLPVKGLSAYKPNKSQASDASDAESALESVARTHRVRLRSLSLTGEVTLDFDFDHGRDLSAQAGDVVLRRGSDPTARAFDETLGAVDSRPEFREALAFGKAEGCRDISGEGLVVCHALRLHEQRVIYVQDTSERPLSELYDLSFQLGRLTLVVVPFAVLLAWWAGRRVVRPIESLHDQVLAKVREARPKPDLEADSSSETADLALAFNTLLDRLAVRRAENEAFIADLVHEFKNPVATIRACADTLGTNTVEAERAARIARLLRESSQRLDTMVSQFLELARAEAGMLKEAWEPVDFASLADGLISTMRQDERFASTTLTLTCARPALVRGVSERLETVLRNLLENACSFAGQGGTVHIEVSATLEQVVISVSDTGPGILEQDKPHVFERFFTTRHHDKGTGLGLALVRAIVEAHGGSVSVESEPGRGATFRAQFPAIS